MSGTQTVLRSDSCNRRYDEGVNDAIYERTMDVRAHMRPDVSQCPQSLGAFCSFSGPLNTKKVHQESFLTYGLGADSSDCPGAGYRSIPEGTFSEPDQRSLDAQKCQRTDMMPLFTRERPSAGSQPNIRESTFVHNLLPQNYQVGYAGLNSMGFGTKGPDGIFWMNQDSRQLARDATQSKNQLEVAARLGQLPVTSGAYGNSRAMSWGQAGQVVEYA